MAGGGGGGGGNAGGLVSPLSVKGDIWGFTVDNARIPVGTPGQYLSADPVEATGVKWVTAAPGTGPWDETAGVVSLVVSSDALCVGSSSVYPVEAGTQNKFRFTDSFATHATWIFENPNAGVEAYGSVMSVNEDGVGASVTSFGKNWDGSANPSFLPGDAGLLYQTIKGIDPAAGACLVIGNGIGSTKFFSGNGGFYTEVMRVVGGVRPGVAIGATTITAANEQLHVSGVALFDTGYSYFEGGAAVPKTSVRSFLVQTDSSAADVLGVDTVHNQLWIEIPSADSTDRIYTSHDAADLSSIHSHNPNSNGLGCLKVTSDVTGYGVLVAGGSTFSQGGFDVAQVGVAAIGMAGGIVIMTQDSAPVALRTNQITRYQVNGNGDMAWFSGTPVPQQGPIADAAGGVVIDAQARTAINSLLAAFRNYALLST